jgi:phosphoserine phosphatase
MDMDSTLITIECIDEIADFVGKKNEVAAITASAMRGEIDWPESLRQRVALLAGLDETVLQRVYEERLVLSPGAELLIATAKKAGINTLLVSGGFTFFTERLKTRLGLDFAFSNTLDIVDGKLTGRVTGVLCDAASKAQHVRETAASLGLQKAQIIVIGDGANDLHMMREAGMSVAYRAKPVVQAEATVAINYVGLDGVLALFDKNT